MNAIRIVRCLAAAAAFAAAGSAFAVAAIGQPAPDFKATDTGGKTVSLADFKGRTVVLEWVNPGCPYVQKHYNSGNMPGTQREATAQGVVWLSIDSTSTEHPDYRAPAALAAWMSEKHAASSATLMDPEGRIGRAYGARTTPHVYVIDTAGKLVYAGAIDSKASARPEDIATATNYVKQALGETLAGKPVSTPLSQPYGCSVKYSSAL